MFAAAAVAIVLSGLHDDLHHADVAVVLGNKVNDDGQPSLMLRARLDHAVELYRRGYFSFIDVSGAQGHEGYNEPAAMRRYLETQGVPPGAIIEDNGGANTWDTARDTAVLMQQRHFQNVLVISQYFHIPRCRLAFCKFGIQTVYTSHAVFWSVRDLYSVPREVAGYLVYAFRHASVVPHKMD